MTSRITRPRALLLTLFAGLSLAAMKADLPGPNLNAARQILSGNKLPRRLGAISLVGFDFWRDLDVGSGIHVLVISCNRSGGLAAYRPDGSEIAALATGEITWIGLFDLNEDGISEVITEEVDAEGTGLLMKSYSLYTVSLKRINRVWKGDSYVYESGSVISGRGRNAIEKVGFLRFDPSGAGEKAKMTYVLTTGTEKTFQKTVFEMNGDTLSRK